MQMKKGRIIVFTMMVLLIMPMVACQKESEPIVGSWVMISAISNGEKISGDKLEENDLSFFAVFSDDNTCALEAPKFLSESTGTWSLTSSTNAEKTKAYSMRFDSDNSAFQFYFMNDDYSKLYGDIGSDTIIICIRKE